MKEKAIYLKEFIWRNSPLLLFLGGFGFDLLTLDRIDHNLTIFQQLIFLFIAFLLVYYRIRKDEETPPPYYPKIDKVLKYHTEIFHFIIGGLLSAYTIFYFLSSSFLSTLTFVFILSALLILNELPRFQAKGTTLRLAMLQVCSISYFVYVVPIFFGKVNGFIFFLSILIAFIPTTLIFKAIYRDSKERILDKLRVPAVVSLVFILLYLFSLIPPIPISLKDVAIYTHVEKQQDQYLAKTRNPRWKFWNKGDQNYHYQVGDSIYLFFSIFAPTKFEDHVFIEWQTYYPKSGWYKSDQIQVSITGGREEGYRGFTYKKNITPGEWRVLILSSDKREIGRIKFEVIPTNDERAPERQLLL